MSQYVYTDAWLNIGKKSNELMCAPKLMREIPVTTFSVRILTEGLPSSKKMEIIKAPLECTGRNSYHFACSTLKIILDSTVGIISLLKRSIQP